MLAAEQAISDLVSEALNRWLPTVQSHVLPTLAGNLAAAGSSYNGDPYADQKPGGKQLPPNLEAFTSSTSAGRWDQLSDDLILTGLAVIWAIAFSQTRSSLDIADKEGNIGVSESPETLTIPAEVAKIVTAATSLTPDQIASVVAQANRSAYISAREDLLATYRQYLKDIPALVQRSAQAAINNLDQAQQSDTGVVRMTISQTMNPASVEMRDLARDQGYQAAAVQNHAVLAAAKSDPDADELEKLWIATMDSRTRDTHFAADGQRAPLKGKFTVGGVQLDRPGDPTGPAREVRNCVVGSTQVRWPGQEVTDATSRRYSGTFVDLITTDGHALTITAKHLVLTSFGYIHADALRPGDDVVTSDIPRSPQIYDMPPRIEQIYRALCADRMPQRIPLGFMDFHGDVSEGDVIEVVRANSDLRNEARESGDVLVGLPGTQSSCAGSGTRDIGSDLNRIDSLVENTRSTSSSVGGQRPGTALLDRHVGSADSVGLRARPDFHPESLKISDKAWATDAESARHLQYADAAGMKLSKLITVDVYSATHDVFNLSTTQEWYIGNGIAVHNCRCRVGVLARDEVLPDEVDRHTERLDGRDATASRREGSIGDEIARRSGKGVVRARDDEQDGLGRTAAGGMDMSGVTAAVGDVNPDGSTVVAEGFIGDDGKVVVTDTDTDDDADAEMFRTFTDQPVAMIGVPTSDGRLIASDVALTVRECPLPLMWMKQSGNGSGGHTEAFTVGVIESAAIDGDTINASGYLLNTPEADEASSELAHGVTAPSVDLAATEWMLTDEDGKEISEEEWWDMPIDATVLQTITAAELIGTTLVATPAFGSTKLQLNDARESRNVAVVASAAADFRPRVYPAAMFAKPVLDGPTLPTMDDTGRIFGHLACFGECHRSIQSQCVMAPRSKTDYAHFHTSPAVRLDDGTSLPVGRLTVGTGHADDRLSGGAAMAHYDNTGSCFALVRVGEDSHGIWFSGIAHPQATAEQIEMGITAPLSGDWRDYGQGLELTAALAVNTPGFAARGREDDRGRPVTLVASLGPAPRAENLHPPTLAAIKAAVAESVRESLDMVHRHAESMELLARAERTVGRPPTPNEQIASMLARR